jgi:hypothetical protein
LLAAVVVVLVIPHGVVAVAAQVVSVQQHLLLCQRGLLLQ